jgi:hypothetical protein
MSGVTAVLDIGKTNVKVATFGGDGVLVWERASLIAWWLARPMRMQMSNRSGIFC